MKKAVVFDLDGTLMNSLPDIAAAMNRALGEVGIAPHDDAAYKRFTGDGAVNLVKRALGDEQQHFDAVYQAYREDYAVNNRVKTAPYEGVPGMLKKLQQAGMKVCVLSNKDESDTLQVVNHYFPDVQFDAIFGKVDGRELKPDPAVLFEMMRGLNLTADDFWYVGDTQTDMECGKNAGMDRVAVLWGFQTKADLEPCQPERFAATPEELSAILLA